MKAQLTTRFLVQSILALTLLSFASLATAQPSAGDRSAAQALFEQARELMQQGNAAEACPKLEESQRLDPGVGTQFNLAECYERVGRFASAYTLYMEVAAKTRSAGQADRESVARQRASAVAPKRSKLVIVVNRDQAPPGLSVERDGAPVGAAQWGMAVPIDPGKHQITASAPGMKPWQGSVDVPADAKTESIQVPALTPLPPQDSTEGASPGEGETPNDPSTHQVGADQSQATGGYWSTQKQWALVAGGVGLVGVGVGTFFGLRALSKNKDSEDYCTGSNCIQPGYDLRNDAIDAGNLATVGFAVGMVGLGTGLTLFLLDDAPSSETTALDLSPSADGHGANLTMRGLW